MAAGMAMPWMPLLFCQFWVAFGSAFKGSCTVRAQGSFENVDKGSFNSSIRKQHGAAKPVKQNQSGLESRSPLKKCFMCLTEGWDDS